MNLKIANETTTTSTNQKNQANNYYMHNFIQIYNKCVHNNFFRFILTPNLVRYAILQFPGETDSRGVKKRKSQKSYSHV